jgi:hypothetical protein
MDFDALTVTRLDFDLRDLENTGAALAVTLFWPSEDQAVLVVAHHHRRPGPSAARDRRSAETKNYDDYVQVRDGLS